MKEFQETDVPYPIEMHGRLFDVVCTAHDCDFRETNYNSPICAALKGTELVIEARGPEPVVRRKDLPHCPKCGQLCRPGVVWFGERPHRIDEILELADEADLCIIVGTSAVVRRSTLLNSFMLTSIFRFSPHRKSEEESNLIGERLLCSMSN